MTTIQIKHRWTGVVLFECEAPEGIEIRQHIRHALEKAIKARAALALIDLHAELWTPKEGAA